jgi:hypothetical protein
MTLRVSERELSRRETVCILPIKRDDHCVQYATVQFYADGPSDPSTAGGGHHKTLSGFKRLMELAAGAGLVLSVLLIGDPRLRKMMNLKFTLASARAARIAPKKRGMLLRLGGRRL